MTKNDMKLAGITRYVLWRSVSARRSIARDGSLFHRIETVCLRQWHPTADLIAGEFQLFQRAGIRRYVTHTTQPKAIAKI